MTAFDIYGIGNALVDTEIEITDADLSRFDIEKGVMTLVDQERQHQLMDHLSDHLVYSRRASGGSAANTLIAASYFGASTFTAAKSPKMTTVHSTSRIWWRQVLASPISLATRVSRVNVW